MQRRLETSFGHRSPLSSRSPSTIPSKSNGLTSAHSCLPPALRPVQLHHLLWCSELRAPLFVHATSLENPGSRSGDSTSSSATRGLVGNASYACLTPLAYRPRFLSVPISSAPFERLVCASYQTRPVERIASRDGTTYLGPRGSTLVYHFSSLPSHHARQRGFIQATFLSASLSRPPAAERVTAGIRKHVFPSAIAPSSCARSRHYRRRPHTTARSVDSSLAERQARHQRHHRRPLPTKTLAAPATPSDAIRQQHNAR